MFALLTSLSCLLDCFTCVSLFIRCYFLSVYKIKTAITAVSWKRWDTVVIHTTRKKNDAYDDFHGMFAYFGVFVRRVFHYTWHVARALNFQAVITTGRQTFSDDLQRCLDDVITVWFVTKLTECCAYNAS